MYHFKSQWIQLHLELKFRGSSSSKETQKQPDKQPRRDILLLHAAPINMITVWHWAGILDGVRTTQRIVPTDPQTTQTSQTVHMTARLASITVTASISQAKLQEHHNELIDESCTVTHLYGHEQREEKRRPVTARSVWHRHRGPNPESSSSMVRLFFFFFFFLRFEWLGTDEKARYCVGV